MYTAHRDESHLARPEFFSGLEMKPETQLNDIDLKAASLRYDWQYYGRITSLSIRREAIISCKKKKKMFVFQTISSCFLPRERFLLILRMFVRGGRIHGH
jgi:hypothetical protein